MTHLLDIIQLVSLRVVERARVWPKLFIIECCEDCELENLVLATFAAEFCRKTRRKKLKKLSFLNNFVNFHAIFHLCWEKSLVSFLSCVMLLLFFLRDEDKLFTD
jgi:hypothetical protein